jgi:glycosyltransferase involved in cell wall biosynthesis
MDAVSSSGSILQEKAGGGLIVGERDYAEAVSLILASNLLYDLDVFDVEIHLGDNKIADSFIRPTPGSAGHSRAWNGDKDCRAVFWGCGIRDIGSLSPANSKYVDFLALRGPISASDLRQGVRLPLGDPALLLSALYECKVKRHFAGKSVCIPDFDESRSDLELQEVSGCDLVLRPQVKMTVASIQDYIDALASASFVLSAHYCSATTAISFAKPFAFWNSGRKALPVEFEDLAGFLSIPAQAAENLSQARELFSNLARPHLKIPSLWPLLVHSPYLLRAEGVLRVLRAELDALPVEERNIALLDRIAQLFANRSHFDQIESQVRVAIHSGSRLDELPSASIGYKASKAPLVNGSHTSTTSNSLIRTNKESKTSSTIIAPHDLEGNQPLNATEPAYERSDLGAMLAKTEAENLALASRLSTATSRIAELEKEQVRAQENTAVLTSQVAALQHEKRTQADAQARSRGDIAKKELAETALMARARADMRRSRNWALGLPPLLLSPAIRRHVRRAADERLVHLFLEKLDPGLAGVARDGREDRVLKYLMGMTDSVADFPLLQNTEYREMHEDVASSGVLPLVHWLRHGRREGRSVHPLLETAYYSSNVPAANAFSSSPAEHYLKWGVLQRQNPHPLFETAPYLERYPDVAQLGINPLCHFLQNPRCTPHWLFDPNYYLNENPDVALAGRNAVTHYLKFGWREGRNPHPFFDTRYYLSNNPDVAASGINPLQHFLVHGVRERRRTSLNFDPEFYLRAYPDIAEGNQIPLRHFIEHGIREGRAPHDAPPVARRPVTTIAASNKPVAVMIDAYYPRPDADSGSIDQVAFAKIFKSLGFDVHYISLIEFGKSDSETASRMKLLHEMGVVCVSSEQYAFIEEYFFINSNRISVVFASRIHFGGAQIGLVRTFCPDAKFIFNTVDLHYLREERQGQITGSQDAIVRARATKEQEFGCIREADATIVISGAEKEILATEGLTKNIYHVPLVREFNDRTPPGFAERKGIAFVGGFKHQPNIDAVEYLLSDIWPKIHRVHPDVVLEIIGSDMPPELAKRADVGVRFVGYVANLDAHLGRLKATIAPLRYGAGAKGKLISSMGNGVPVIASRVAAEGMGFEPDHEIIIADTPDDYVAAIAALHGDSAVWQRLSDNGRERVRRDNSFGKGLSLMKHMLANLGVHSDVSTHRN